MKKTRRAAIMWLVVMGVHLGFALAHLAQRDWDNGLDSVVFGLLSGYVASLLFQLDSTTNVSRAVMDSLARQNRRAA